MAFLTNLVSDAMSLLWGNSHEAQPPLNDPSDIFKGDLSAYFELHINQDECIENCIKSVKNLLYPVDCDLSATSQMTIQFHLDNFNKAVDETMYSDGYFASSLGCAFKKSLYPVVEEKWTEHMAASFYHILSLADEKEQRDAAKQWTHHYFTGVDYLNKWEGFHTYLQGKFVAKLELKTRIALRAYSHERIQEKMEIMQSRAEKDPISFEKRLEGVIAKKDKDPTSLSISEKEYTEFLEILASCVTLHWPNIDKKEELLKACIWRGYTLRTVKLPILNSDSDLNFFTGVFKKV